MMATLIYNGVRFGFAAATPTVALLKHLILEVASGRRPPMWLPGTTDESGGQVNLLLAPGISAILITDPDYVDLPAAEAAGAIIQGDNDIGSILLRIAQDRDVDCPQPGGSESD